LRTAGQVKVNVVKEHDIAQYSTRFPEVAEVATCILPAVREEFGQEAELLLEVYHDPEITDEYLKVCVRLPRYDQSVRERLRSLSATCEERLADTAGHLSITTDYRLASPHAAL
jgi:hypothetical protein